MPVMLWVVFWSSMMATTTACFGETPQPVALKKEESSRN